MEVFSSNSATTLHSGKARLVRKKCLSKCQGIFAFEDYNVLLNETELPGALNKKLPLPPGMLG